MSAEPPAAAIAVSTPMGQGEEAPSTPKRGSKRRGRSAAVASSAAAASSSSVQPAKKRRTSRTSEPDATSEVASSALSNDATASSCTPPPAPPAYWSGSDGGESDSDDEDTCSPLPPLAPAPCLDDLPEERVSVHVKASRMTPRKADLDEMEYLLSDSPARRSFPRDCPATEPPKRGADHPASSSSALRFNSPYSSRLSVAREVVFSTPPPASLTVRSLATYSTQLTRTLRLANSVIAFAQPPAHSPGARSSASDGVTSTSRPISVYARMVQHHASTASSPQPLLPLGPLVTKTPAITTTLTQPTDLSTAPPVVVLPRTSPRRRKATRQLF